MSIDTSSSRLSLRSIIAKHEEQLMDFEKCICLLCKRGFKNADQIKRHRSLSRLHSSRLRRLKQRIFTEEQLERMDRKEREALYRDRAKERRLKFGQADAIVTERIYHSNQPHSSKSNRKVPRAPIDSGPAKPLGLDNKGAALLSKMGWTEGSGLGKSKEGIIDIIKLDANVGTSGLGSYTHKAYKAEPHLSYKEAVKKIMYQRYHEISSEEDSET